MLKHVWENPCQNIRDMVETSLGKKKKKMSKGLLPVLIALGIAVYKYSL